MSVAVLNGPTVKDFVEDGEAFIRCVDELFSTLDVDGDGVLSRSELRKGFERVTPSESELESRWTEEIGDLEGSVFEKFDYNQSGMVDLEEFRAEMREIMLAVARGIGDSPIQVALERNSFLMRAVERESSKRGV